MSNQELLIEAINKRKPISFTYNKEGKASGTRVGNTHAVYNFQAKSGQKSIKVHIVQTDGVSDSVDKNPFPDFRQFNIEEIGDIVILNDEPEFEIFDEKYNRDWEGYSNAIAKV